MESRNVQERVVPCENASVSERQPRPVHDAIEITDPLARPDWDNVVSASVNGGFFMGSGWAKVLHDTYGHRPLYYSTVASSKLQAGLAAMEISSVCTGQRGVSLPFTDYCPIVAPSPEVRRALCSHVLEEGRRRRWRYFECRSNDFDFPGAEPSLAFYGHLVELTGEPAVRFKKLENPMRRSIRKAQDAKLRVEFEASPEAMRQFYALHCRTRRRHGVPPQPLRFFDNIQRHIIGVGQGFISTIRLEGRPIAAAVFFARGREAIYKFGASDYRFQQMRANNLLMWESMNHCATLGCEFVHLGRTSMGQEGLRRFKLGFGAREQQIKYYRYDYGRRAFVRSVDRANSMLGWIFKLLPAPLFRLAGALLYPHLS